jgi:hypothetical protein
MPGLYYIDLDHLREYAKVAEDRSGKAVQNYYAEYIYGTNNFNEFLKKCGGQKRLDELRRIELMEERSDEIENTELIERRA